MIFYDRAASLLLLLLLLLMAYFLGLPHLTASAPSFGAINRASVTTATVTKLTPPLARRVAIGVDCPSE